MCIKSSLDSSCSECLGPKVTMSGTRPARGRCGNSRATKGEFPRPKIMRGQHRSGRSDLNFNNKSIAQDKIVGRLEITSSPSIFLPCALSDEGDERGRRRERGRGFEGWSALLQPLSRLIGLGPDFYFGMQNNGDIPRDFISIDVSLFKVRYVRKKRERKRKRERERLIRVKWI
ncbi:hypothetical protein PUN28_006411 [Cardiocondyla obscurior]|uniref:Uncharacterized protein n=1 Tax=Cardiocondyla obscurior TaxID=286306 RepID=A0AAW2G947_9HYME